MLQRSFNLSEALEALTGSQTVQDFMATPLEDFVRRVVGAGDGGSGRGFETVGDALGRAASAAKPALGLLDYENAFSAVQVRSRVTRFSYSEHFIYQFQGQILSRPHLTRYPIKVRLKTIYYRFFYIYLCVRNRKILRRLY